MSHATRPFFLTPGVMNPSIPGVTKFSNPLYPSNPFSKKNRAPSVSSVRGITFLNRYLLAAGDSWSVARVTIYEPYQTGRRCGLRAARHTARKIVNREQRAALRNAG